MKEKMEKMQYDENRYPKKVRTLAFSTKNFPKSFLKKFSDFHRNVIQKVPTDQTFVASRKILAQRLKLKIQQPGFVCFELD